jgi:hypothetical protein
MDRGRPRHPGSGVIRSWNCGWHGSTSGQSVHDLARAGCGEAGSWTDADNPLRPTAPRRGSRLARGGAPHPLQIPDREIRGERPNRRGPEQDGPDVVLRDYRTSTGGYGSDGADADVQITVTRGDTDDVAGQPWNVITPPTVLSQRMCAPPRRRPRRPEWSRSWRTRSVGVLLDPLVRGRASFGVPHGRASGPWNPSGDLRRGEPAP